MNRQKDDALKYGIHSLCNGWEYVPEWTAEFGKGKGSGFEEVRLPHDNIYPFHYATPEDYERVCGYRKNIYFSEELKEKHIFLQFDGAAHIATLYVNGEEVATHGCGYTAFRTEITDHVKFGKENLISVKLDSTENPSVPPFGFVIDYLTYGGLYREAWLDIRNSEYIEDVFVSTVAKTLFAKTSLSGNVTGLTLEYALYDGDVCIVSANMEADRNFDFQIGCPKAELWDTEHPKLYRLVVELKKGRDILDTQEINVGFRDIQFRNDGFYLNGKKLFIRGLNRHQSYPYLGYAAPKHLQEEDARIMKEELALNAVRTSHYPQSRYFVDACDRLGLLVFTEIPGWQHIGESEGWKEQAVKNVEEMVLQYRNHPSVVLWGVRINESQDCDELYEITNKKARELDHTRPTSGVRYIEKSHLLEDVYAYNDFSHDGTNPGCRPKSKVTNEGKPLLISEACGHMFPTKSFDPWEKRQSHALRHSTVLEDAMRDGDHLGVFQWCMFDYQTHKDFGSGDRICYHGVMDGFRNPKLAAAFYASQGEIPVLEVSSPMDIGDYPAGRLPGAWVFSNGEKVVLRKNGVFVKEFIPDPESPLPHPPVEIDDIIGDLLNSQEGFTGKKETLIHDCLKAAQKYGISTLPFKYKVKLAWAMLRYRLSYNDGVNLYGKYVGNWGGESTVWTFEAIRSGEVVACSDRAPASRLSLEVRASASELQEGDAYDMAAIRIRVLDEYRNLASYAQLPVSFTVEGDTVQIVGPHIATLEGGMGGTYIRTTGKTGKSTLHIGTSQCDTVSVEFIVK